MRMGCGDQAVALIPTKALKLGLSLWSFRVLAELCATPQRGAFRCITYNEISWNCFMPRTDRTEKALAELQRCGILKILRRVAEGFSFEIRPENEWRFVPRTKTQAKQ
jgi:hypothetical protein